MRYVIVLMMTAVIAAPGAAGERKPGELAAKYAGELTTPLVPGTLAKVAVGLDTYTNPFSVIMVCVSDGKAWIGDKKIKMFEGKGAEILPDVAADLVAARRDRARRERDKVRFDVQFAFGPDTKFGDIAGLISAVVSKVTVSSYELVASGKDEKLGLIPLHLPEAPRRKQGEQAKSEPVNTVHVSVTNDRIDIVRGEAAEKVYNPDGKNAPDLDLGALADAVASVLPKNYKTPEYVIVSAKGDVSWQRVLQVAGVVRGAFAGSGKLPEVVLAVIE